MAVFPEKMDRLNPNDTMGSLRRLENYINYMRERMEFAAGNLSRSVSGSGTATAEVLQLLLNLTSSMSSMQTTINALCDDVNAAKRAADEALNKVTEDIDCGAF